MAKQRVSLEFQIKSTDPHRSTAKAVTEIRALSAEFQTTVTERLPGAKVQIRRAEGIPVLPELQNILLNVDWDVVRKGAESAVSAFLTTQFLNFLKNKIKGLQARKASAAAAKSAGAAKKKPAAKKTGGARKKRK